MDFFDSACQEPPIQEKLFGICDDGTSEKAYTDVLDPIKWIAKVKNEKQFELIFTAVDKCIIKDNEEKGRGRCDGMLTSDEHLYFIELKDELKNWKTDAIEQLGSTISFFNQHHDLSKYRHKKAFACNKKRKAFQVIDNELSKRFFSQYGFRIDVQAEIIIV